MAGAKDDSLDAAFVARATLAVSDKRFTRVQPLAFHRDVCMPKTAPAKTMKQPTTNFCQVLGIPDPAPGGTEPAASGQVTQIGRSGSLDGLVCAQSS